MGRFLQIKQQYLIAHKGIAISFVLVSLILILNLFDQSTSLLIPYFDEHIEVGALEFLLPIVILLVFIFRNKIKNVWVNNILDFSFSGIFSILALIIGACFALALANLLAFQFNYAGAASLMGLFWYSLFYVTYSVQMDIKTRIAIPNEA